MRQLRDFAGLEQIELAARAHYPRDYIRAAETGPALPDLPLLAAYVRGCGGTTEEWEERWRVLTNTPALTLLPVRSAGDSTAASAGSRIGLAFQTGDAPDPAAIMAALNRVAEKIAADTASPPRPSPTTASPAGQESVASADWAGGPSAQSGAVKADATAPWEKASAPATLPAPKSTAPAGPAASGSAAFGSAAAAASTEAAAGPGTGTVANGPAGRSFSMTSRTTIAALIALAICVIVAVLAIFA